MHEEREQPTLSKPLITLCLIAMAAPVAAAELPVDLELVLAVDISGSVDAEEARQQRDGYVAAISHPAVIEAISANFYQRIAVAYLEWAEAISAARARLDADRRPGRRGRVRAAPGGCPLSARSLDLDQRGDRRRAPIVRR